VKGYPTTFLGLFDPPQGQRPAINAIEIPIIQRDFAQGRSDDETSAIRERFLDAIIHAATTTESIGLDFVYGDVKDGVLHPLDGQQRLTTLFLLHWYVASRANVLDSSAPWLRFSYATRPTARDFSRALAENPFPSNATKPSDWITDQPWYVYPWRQDPTILSMLVVLDAIHQRLHDDATDFGAVWERLSTRSFDQHRGAIWFLFLPVIDMDYGEDLYIKMNSRGKPLTLFEVFKADFEATIASADKGRHKHLVDSVDGPWADVLWEYEKTTGGDCVIDDEFMRYLTFVIDVCEWRDGAPDRKWRDKTGGRLRPIEDRARLSFADAGNPNAPRNRDFLFHAFDTWVGVDPGAEMRKLFRVKNDGGGELLLLASTSPDLFGACISKYGTGFSLTEALLLFAVLLARQAGDAISSEQLERRLRTLRNIAESAFLDSTRMTEYVGTTERLILSGTLDGAQGFQQYWTADEQAKWNVMDAHPEATKYFHILEDNITIRGRLFALDIESVAAIPARATAFSVLLDPALRDRLGAALLTKADYSRDVGWNGTRRQLGSSQRDDSWRDLFTSGSRDSVKRIREPLMTLLDDVSKRLKSGTSDAGAVLNAICSEWCAAREHDRCFDWRYYLVRYPGARSSVGEGFYHGSYDASRGFAYSKLRILHGSSYAAYFTDALLMAAWIEGSLEKVSEKPSWWHEYDRGLCLKKSKIELRVTDDGFEVLVPDGFTLDATATAAVANEFPGFDGVHLRVAQTDRDGVLVDAEDRVQRISRLVVALATAGL
jgi:hypothetical protein